MTAANGDTLGETVVLTDSADQQARGGHAGQRLRVKAGGPVPGQYVSAVQAAKHTYKLSTLFENTYANSDTTRTYPWGYLAVRHMAENHPDDVQRMLARFRAGDYAGGYAVYHDGIGTRYDAGFHQWLTVCAAGA
ncbi:hypothetical protein GQF42_05335 [Streptomyces broussonetiae]|uniref:Uncharacterized protein n=1 Tax=Streptomyces broussonetiae TaxID=2686304 RepID=A0A6I6MTJ5_9ACTN|nr:collagenase [Streptomyces broussonetiae]QHA02782.1 hypothetical protein GQF42_05335 [Streptomyces broussonetiae]